MELRLNLMRCLGTFWYHFVYETATYSSVVTFKVCLSRKLNSTFIMTLFNFSLTRLAAAIIDPKTTSFPHTSTVSPSLRTIFEIAIDRNLKWKVYIIQIEVNSECTSRFLCGRVVRTLLSSIVLLGKASYRKHVTRYQIVVEKKKRNQSYLQ